MPGRTTVLFWIACHQLPHCSRIDLAHGQVFVNDDVSGGVNCSNVLAMLLQGGQRLNLELAQLPCVYLQLPTVTNGYIGVLALCCLLVHIMACNRHLMCMLHGHIMSST